MTESHAAARAARERGSGVIDDVNELDRDALQPGRTTDGL